MYIRAQPRASGRPVSLCREAYERQSLASICVDRRIRRQYSRLGLQLQPHKPAPLASTGVRLAMCKVRLLGNKFLTVASNIIAYDLNVLFVTELWHSTSSDILGCRAAPLGYSYYDLLRQTDTKALVQNHGDIVIYFKDTLTVKVTALPDRPTTFEILCLSCTSPRGPSTLLTIYRPGSFANTISLVVLIPILATSLFHSWPSISSLGCTG